MTDKIAKFEKISIVLNAALAIDLILLFGFIGYGVFISYAVEVFLALLIPLFLLIPLKIVNTIIMRRELRKERLSPEKSSALPKVKSYSQSNSAMLSELERFSAERGIGEKPKTEVIPKKQAHTIVLRDSSPDAVFEALARVEKASREGRTIRDDVNYTNKILDEAKSYFMSGRFSDAIKYYDEVLKLDPKNTTALLNKGNALSELGNHEEAIQYNEKVLKIEPQNASAWFNKANSLGMLRRFDESIRSYEEALKIEPNKPNYLTNLGYIYQHLGDYDKALEYYNKALSIDPSFTPAITSKTRALTEKRAKTFKP